MLDDPGSSRQIHDLKNYIGVVVGFAELLLSDLSPNDPHYADVEEVQKAANRALEIIRELTAGQEIDR